MFSFQYKKRYLFSIITLCLSNLLSQSDIALAQMRLGRGIQPGLEGHLLEYQIQKQPLTKMRGISGCAIGSGVGCNKTASLLQKIVTESSGKTYQDLLFEAAGGRDNYLKFASYYSQSINLDSAPFNSFWINGGDYVLDSHQYLGIENLNRVSRSNLSEVVNQFSSASITSGTENLSLKQGLIGLKTAYGMTLLEEARQIPHIAQKIAASGLSQEESDFHLQQFINSVEAIESGDRQQLNRSLYKLLSNPYASEPEVLNRPSMGISSSLDETIGVGLEGDEYIASVLGGEASETVIFNSPEVATTSNTTSSGNAPLYVIAGVGGVALLAILLNSSDGGSGSNALAPPSNIDNSDGNNNPSDRENAGNNEDSGGTDNPDSSGEPELNPFPPDSDTPDVEIPPVVIVKDPTSEPPVKDRTVTIPESTSILQFVFLIALTLSILKKKKSEHSYLVFQTKVKN